MYFKRRRNMLGKEVAYKAIFSIAFLYLYLLSFVVIGLFHNWWVASFIGLMLIFAVINEVTEDPFRIDCLDALVILGIPAYGILISPAISWYLAITMIAACIVAIYTGTTLEKLDHSKEI